MACEDEAAAYLVAVAEVLVAQAELLAAEAAVLVAQQEVSMAYTAYQNCMQAGARSPGDGTSPQREPIYRLHRTLERLQKRPQ